MTDIEQKESLLRQLELLTDRSDEEAKQERRTVWRQLVAAFNKADERELVQFLAAELQLQPITIKRWLLGEFNPRYAYISRLRSLLGLGQRLVKSSASSLGEAPDPPVVFDNAFASIRTFNHFFYCLKFSKLAFILKGQLGYHAGRPGSIREAVISLLEEKEKSPEPLIMYYIFFRPSPAQETLGRFLTSPRVQLSGIYERKLVRPLALTVENDALGLAHSPVSPFVLIYNDEGRKLFDRFVDVFLETPVEFVQTDNSPIDYEQSLKTALIQLPETEAIGFWKDLAGLLRRAKGQRSKGKKPEEGPADLTSLDERHLEVPDISWPSTEPGH